MPDLDSGEPRTSNKDNLKKSTFLGKNDFCTEFRYVHVLLGKIKLWSILITNNDLAHFKIMYHGHEKNKGVPPVLEATKS